MIELTEEEMDVILAMYAVVCGEGQETGAMINLVKRIKKKRGDE